MKSKKNNINILVIFIILAIIGLIIYIVLHNRNRNRKQNPTTSDILTNPSPFIIIVPKDPNSISIGFSPVVDKNTGNISISESYNALGSYKMNYIFGGKKILNVINILPQFFNSLGITIDEFSLNTGAIAITNVILPQNPEPGNIPYPGKDLTMYVLNKKTGLMNSYNIYRSVTVENKSKKNYNYNYGNVNINNISNKTPLVNSIKDYTDTPNGPVFITFYVGV